MGVSREKEPFSQKNDMEQGKSFGISLTQRCCALTLPHLTAPNQSGVKPPLQPKGFDLATVRIAFLAHY